ncbi:hypothetical protein DSM104299_02714 [Baekduia alba]|uniref:DUF6941 family protein n=1 Tax=Baekduia alba TaxID=2997333 RepID=UPI00234066AC|nr:hypothetical protein [Baekduia alba]WCB93986.1 hypothetical protein DSM104299_02714 [Baekduia alba]
MNVDWVIPCRYVEVHDNLGSMIGAGIDTFWVPELPAPLQVMLAVRLTATAEELSPGIQHVLRTVVTDKHGEVVFEATVEFEADSEVTQTEWLNSMVMPSVVQFEAVEAGTFQLEQSVDGNSQSIPLHVIEGPPE